MGKGYNRFQGKPDANTSDIVELLRKHKDIRVRFLGKPVDLMIGYRGLNFLIEIKNPDGRDERGEAYERQLRFIADWTGSAVICKTYEEVLSAIGYQ